MITFDELIYKLCRSVPFVGKRLEKTYRKHAIMRKFVKYFTSIFIVYWGVRAPLQWFLIDYVGLWHQLGTFIAGCIVSLIGFGYSHFWVWRKND